ncbi:MAG: tetratricopeptide repeat protein [Ignavibacteriae bacterium]|nr:tetratricopeptide repeat protein [Ignavibacteriota bacterium]
MDCLHNKEFYYATNFCEKAIIEEPNNFNAYHFLGISYVKTEQFERALVCFDKAIQINPDFPNSWGWKGSVLKLLGKKEEGDECILKSKELEKKNDGRK